MTSQIPMFFNKLFKRCSLQPSIAPAGCLPGASSAHRNRAKDETSFYR
jgi:hypothetical protein